MRASDLTIVSQWARLGITWNVRPHQRQPDLEPLLLDSLHHVASNPRLLILIASWLSECWRCVGRDRLRTLALQRPPAEQAILGFMLQSVDAWLPVAVWPSVHRKLARLAHPEPLLQHDRDHPPLRRLVDLEATPLARSWGLLSLPIEPRRDALRPISWILHHNPPLRARSIFKGALKTSILAIVDQRGELPSASQLARECGVTRKAVYDALEDLTFSNLLADPLIQA